MSLRLSNFTSVVNSKDPEFTSICDHVGNGSYTRVDLDFSQVQEGMNSQVLTQINCDGLP